MMRRKKKPTGTRERFSFWLDLTKDDHFFLADLIHDLKQQRSFAGTIRDGVRLICDLRAGRLDVLFELFPWIQAEFLEHKKSTAAASSGDDDSDLKASIQRLEQLFLQQNSGPIMAPASGPKAMNVPKIAAPVAQDGDEDMLVMKKAKSNGSASENFLKSAFAVAGIQQ